MNKKRLEELLFLRSDQLYSGISEEVDSLEKLKEYVYSNELKELFQGFIAVAKEHKEHLGEVFFKLDRSSSGKKYGSSSSIVGEMWNLVKKCKEAEILDAGLASTLRQLKQFEISSLRNAMAHADDLGYEDISRLMKTMKEDVEKLDQQVHDLAHEKLNKDALRPA